MKFSVRLFGSIFGILLISGPFLVRSRAQTAKRTQSLNEVLAPIGPDKLHPVRLEISEQTYVSIPNRGRLFVTVHRRINGIDRYVPSEPLDGLLTLWRPVGKRYLLLRSLENQAGPLDPRVGDFETPEAFVYQDEVFLLVTLNIYRGQEFTILWVAPDSSLHDVTFVPGSERYTGLRAGEIVYFPADIHFDADQMTFSFGVWTKDDAVASPSYQVRGRYELIGGKVFDPKTKTWSSNFQIVPSSFERRVLPNSQQSDGWELFQDRPSQ